MESSSSINMIAVLLSLLERFPQVWLGFSSELGHDLGSVDEKEEGSSLVGDSASHESFSCLGRSVEENSTRGLHADRLEETWVAQRLLNHLLVLGELLAAPVNVVLSDGIESALFILALNRLPRAVDHGVGGGVSLNNLNNPELEMCERFFILCTLNSTVHELDDRPQGNRASRIPRTSFQSNPKKHWLYFGTILIVSMFSWPKAQLNR